MPSESDTALSSESRKLSFTILSWFTSAVRVREAKIAKEVGHSPVIRHSVLFAHRSKRRLRSKVKRAEQLAILIDRGILGGQKFIPVKDGVCPCEQTEGLRFFRKPGAPGRQTDLRPRQCDPGRCNQANQLENIDGGLVFQGCA